MMGVTLQDGVKGSPTHGRKYAFFLGCIMPLRYPGVELATRIVLERLGIKLEEIEGASCCPAPGVIGSFDLKSWLVVACRNLALAEKMNLDILTCCNGCYATLQEANHIVKCNNRMLKRVNGYLKRIGLSYNGGVDVYHVVEVLDYHSDMFISGRLDSLKIAPHYGCHYLRPSKIRGHGKKSWFLHRFISLSKAIPVEYKELWMCCGAGGGVRSAHKDLSLRYTLRKVESMKNAGAELIVTPCIFCHLQFDIGQYELIEAGLLDDPLPVLHVTQLAGLMLGFEAGEIGIDLNKIAFEVDKIGDAQT